MGDAHADETVGRKIQEERKIMKQRTREILDKLVADGLFASWSLEDDIAGSPNVWLVEPDQADGVCAICGQVNGHKIMCSAGRGPHLEYVATVCVELDEVDTPSGRLDPNSEHKIYVPGETLGPEDVLDFVIDDLQRRYGIATRVTGMIDDYMDATAYVTVQSADERVVDLFAGDHTVAVTKIVVTS